MRKKTKTYGLVW